MACCSRKSTISFVDSNLAAAGCEKLELIILMYISRLEITHTHTTSPTHSRNPQTTFNNKLMHLTSLHLCTFTNSSYFSFENGISTNNYSFHYAFSFVRDHYYFFDAILLLHTCPTNVLQMANF